MGENNTEIIEKRPIYKKWGFWIIIIALAIITIQIEIKIFDEKEMEAKYQEGIKLIEQSKWEDASVDLVMLVAEGPGARVKEDYKDSGVLYHYTNAKENEVKGFTHMAAYYVKEIPDSYNGPLADQIMPFKKKMISMAESMTQEQILEEMKNMEEDEKKYNREHNIKVPEPDLQITETHSESGSYNWYAAGTVKNNTDKKFSYVQVEINLYDFNGNQVGSTLTNINNMDPNGTWKFRAPVIEKNATKFKAKVSGW